MPQRLSTTIKEEYNVFMDALIKSKGTVKKDLEDIIIN